MTSLSQLCAEAYEKATPEQRRALRTVVLPLMHGAYLETGDESEVRRAVSDIMGQEV